MKHLLPTIAVLATVTVCGCDSERSRLKTSDWYKTQKSWAAADTDVFGSTREIWLGSIHSVDTNAGWSVGGPLTTVVLQPAALLVGRKSRQSYTDGVHIDWPTNAELPHACEQWAVSCERDIKGARWAHSYQQVAEQPREKAEQPADAAASSGR